jgi:hypothetical protein
MININELLYHPRWVLVFVLTLIGAHPASAENLHAYEADEFTLHLWHLDEAGPPFPDSAKNGIPLRGMHNGAAP